MKGLLRSGVLAAGLATAGLLAACSSGPSDHSPQSGAAPASPSARYQQKALAYASCMRGHGITNFPDPNSQGSFVGEMGHLNASSPQYQKANDGCKTLLPNGGHPTSSESQKLETYALAYASCMRSHGITNFPDPTLMSNGAVSIGGAGVETGSPQYISANQACHADLHQTGSDA